MDREVATERYIELDPRRPGPAEARLRASGVPVWILVAQLSGVHGDIEQVAADYHLPPGEVRAALAYYQCHKQIIDARIAMNAA